MLVIVEVESMGTHQIEAPNEENLEILMQLIMIETGIPLNEQQISFNGKLLTNHDQTMTSLGISDGSKIHRK